jgi:hypothetical protein
VDQRENTNSALAADILLSGLVDSVNGMALSDHDNQFTIFIMK